MRPLLGVDSLHDFGFVVHGGPCDIAQCATIEGATVGALVHTLWACLRRFHASTTYEPRPLLYVRHISPVTSQFRSHKHGTCAPVRLYKEKKTKEGIRGGRISVDTTNHPRQVPLYPSLIRFRGFNPPTPPQFSSSVFLRIRLSRVISFLFVSYFYCRRGWEIDVSILRAYFRRFSGFRVRGWRCPYPRFPAGLRGCIFEGYTTCVTV